MFKVYDPEDGNRTPKPSAPERPRRTYTRPQLKELFVGGTAAGKLPNLYEGSEVGPS